MHARRQEGDVWKIISLLTRSLEVALVGAVSICLWMSNNNLFIDY